jgi:hypothetical protein
MEAARIGQWIDENLHGVVKLRLSHRGMNGDDPIKTWDLPDTAREKKRIPVASLAKQIKDECIDCAQENGCRVELVLQCLTADGTVRATKRLREDPISGDSKSPSEPSNPEGILRLLMRHLEAKERLLVEGDQRLKQTYEHMMTLQANQLRDVMKENRELHNLLKQHVVDDGSAEDDDVLDELADIVEKLVPGAAPEAAKPSNGSGH